MLDCVTIKQGGVIITMYLCNIALAAYQLTDERITALDNFWSDILTEIFIWCLTTILDLYASA